MARKCRLNSIPNLAEIVAQSISWTELSQRLGYKSPAGGTCAFLRKKIQQAGIDTSHFIQGSWAKGHNRFNDERIAKQAARVELPWEEAFKKGSTVRNSILIKRLISAGKKQYKCEECGISNWRGKPVRLHLDHMDGDNSNAEESNLRLICPNCHSQTETYCRSKSGDFTKNLKNHLWWQQLSLGIKENKSDKRKYSVRKKGEKQKSFCVCGEEKTKKALRCVLCEYKERRNRKIPQTLKFEVTKEELEKLVWEMPTSHVSKKFGVSDKAIEDRCKKLGIAKPPRGYWAKKKFGVI